MGHPIPELQLLRGDDMRKPNKDKQTGMEEPKFAFKSSLHPYQQLTPVLQVGFYLPEQTQLALSSGLAASEPRTRSSKACS
jgi:hypothetical protein